MTRFAILVILVLALAACKKVEEPGEQILAANLFGNVRTFTDHDTGCQYLIWRDYERGGIAPRLGSDGKPICNPEGGR